MIGLNHLVNGALLNPDVTVLVHNNFLFGMTGGQNSAFTPVDFVTSTTPEGSFVAAARPGPGAARRAVRRSSRATVTGDRGLADVLARAIAHPGFAVVEVLELCTALRDALEPAHRREAARGRRGGRLRARRPPRRAAPDVRRRLPRAAPEAADEPAVPAAPSFEHRLDRAVRLVLAGTAGERVQSAASALARAALLCGLHATQKNDNPVTQGTGFSVSEVILDPEPILYTGIERPDVVLVVSGEGARELAVTGMLERVGPDTLVLADAEVDLPQLAASPRRLPLRETAGPKGAALAAVEAWVEQDGRLPVEALRAAVEARRA